MTQQMYGQGGSYEEKSFKEQCSGISFSNMSDIQNPKPHDSTLTYSRNSPNDVSSKSIATFRKTGRFPSIVLAFAITVFAGCRIVGLLYGGL